MKKAFIFFVVVLLFLFLLNGCGGNKLTGAAIGVSEPVKIGVLLPLTGDAAAYGENAKKGIELALEETNIVAVYEDGKCNAQDSASGMKKLIAEDVMAVIGELCGDATAAAYEIAKDSEVGMINPTYKDITLSNIAEYASKEYKPVTLIGKQFENKYKNKYSEEPGIFAAEGYDAVLALNEAIGHSDGSKKGIKSALRDVKFDGASV